jgi:predicted DNA-binding transcriptional regulator AlpA
MEPLTRAYDVAGLLGCSTETVIRWAREGKLPGAVFLPHGRVAFNGSVIESFIHEGGHVPATPLRGALNYTRRIVELETGRQVETA